jgi:hypothetical protein
VKIRLFIKPYCGFAEMVKLSGQTLAPVIDVDGKILADFGPDELAKFLGENFSTRDDFR